MVVLYTHRVAVYEGNMNGCLSEKLHSLHLYHADEIREADTQESFIQPTTQSNAKYYCIGNKSLVSTL